MDLLSEWKVGVNFCTIPYFIIYMEFFVIENAGKNNTTGAV